jgi:penicillin-binding protein 2
MAFEEICGRDLLFNEGIRMRDIIVKNLDQKIKVLNYIVIGIFFMIFLRVWYLQIILGPTILLKSRENQTRVIRINAPRGIFFDRNGKIMVSTRISHNVMMIPDDVKDKPEVIKSMSKLLRCTETELRSKLKPDPQKRGLYPYQYITVEKDINLNTLVKLYEAKMDLPGVEIDEFPLRYYKNAEFASRLFGYGFIAMVTTRFRAFPNVGPSPTPQKCRYMVRKT